MTSLLTIYQRLFDHYGPQHWWPADSAFEMVVGAILTQNTNWNNVEKALANLKQAQALSLPAILAMEPSELEQLIRPAGFFRQKAQRLQLFCRHIDRHHQGDLRQLLQQPLPVARKELLSLKGIGPETADSMLLYAGEQATFVVDAYTRRVFERLGFLKGKESYAEIRTLFMTELPLKFSLYNEYHALIVMLCKDFCRKKPLCPQCPCRPLCPHPLLQLAHEPGQSPAPQGN